MFHGKIPSTLSSCKQLRELSLSSNYFSGTIPKEIGNLTKLTRLNLRQNKLQGEIPEELGNLAELEMLWLQNNSLTGTIPSSIFSLSSLLNLDLSLNNFTGIIPSSIGNLSSLQKLYLSDNQLSGELPANIGNNLPSLQTLSLYVNDFSGAIPKEIGNLTKLTDLYLDQNKLQGKIPHEIGNLRKLEWLMLSHNKLVGVVPAPIFNLSTLISLQIHNNSLSGSLPSSADVPLPNLEELFLWGYRKRGKQIPNDANMPPVATWRRFSYLELFRATDGFSENNLIGRGGFGSVYRARIHDGIEVAVKVFNLQYVGALKSFDVECDMMKSIRHRNLIKIITSCSNEDFKALVLEYMPHGSLEECLYSSNHILDISQRLNIMIDVASALEYLHFGYAAPVIHCDLKPSNVLLDNNMVAHLSDFGMAKLLLGEDQFLTQTQTLATIGYMAPEYGREGRVSTNGDIYNFGIMIMETFTAKKPTDEIFNGEMTLRRWVNDLLSISVMEVVDANLLSWKDKHFMTKEQCMSFVFNLAMECTVESPIRESTQRKLLQDSQKLETRCLKMLRR
ncbi:probable LRR receptor-like serine/threonine-protein kinase At3g47570 isoform X5 [Citrus sinensis]|uniref:probable LRR receptor-like serine/threonine-protein kinase At3g47570 isoform X5 n=1 Tax=Citrus sinensis TaxID=2711 RepID=UPI0022784DEF|nr:probable LRR receptor-like serine/threonine-protein kinase At3g47570 isoform X5 [Citrus sinensis]